MTNRLLTFSLLALLLAESPPVEAQAPPVGREARLAQLLQRFPEADMNRDGLLTEDEVKAYQKKRRAIEKQRATPTHPDLRYGPHHRNLIDVWLPSDAATVEEPIPVIVYFHGGGFVAGDKGGFDPTPYLEAGYAVASGNYRYVDGTDTLCPDPMIDATRAVQFLKSKAGDWNLDKDRFALSGGSAGAVIAMWIAYHDEMASPDSEDPVERESSRVAAVVPVNGPANLNPEWIRENLGGPASIHGSMPKMFGAAWDSPEGLKRVLECSPWEFVSADDPPTFLVYSTKMTEVPLPASASSGELVHHPYFGQELEKRLDEIGVTAKFVHGHDPRKGDAVVAFLSEVFAD